MGTEKRNGSAKNLAPKSARAKERPPTLTYAHYGQKQSPAKQHLRPAPKILDGRGYKEQRKTLVLRGAGKKGKARAHKAKPKQRAKKSCGRTYQTEVRSPSCTPASPQTGPHQALLVLSPRPRVSPKPAEKEKTEQHRTAKKSQAPKHNGTPPPKLSQSTPVQSKAQPETPKGRAGTQVGREKRNGTAKNLAPKSAWAKERPPTLTLAHYGQKQSPAKQHLRPAPKTLDGRGYKEQRKTLILSGASKKGQSTCPKQSKA